ncbi:hypothetical protein [Granulicella sp. S190]|uniref:hypothetical protein n=1 Tax=Granulicella sp. S190 TaxID=1747226 RepID=UPI00131C700D|nr:hypothetical protein [Granulicella sp. S190]
MQTPEDKLIRFVESIEADLFPPEPNESPLRTQWRRCASITQRLALYDAAFEDNRPVDPEAFWRLICVAEERERKSREALQEEERSAKALRGER